MNYCQCFSQTQAHGSNAAPIILVIHGWACKINVLYIAQVVDIEFYPCGSSRAFWVQEGLREALAVSVSGECLQGAKGWWAQRMVIIPGGSRYPHIRY